MNGPIVRVFGVVLVLFAVLIFFTTRWTVIERDDLRDNPLNKRALLQQQRVARGAIIAADGSTLAPSRRTQIVTSSCCGVYNAYFCCACLTAS